MEPHPIPQNVTTFQFKLVGDMTLKQFIYLVSGAGMAYLLFVFLAPYYPLIAWPLIIIFASLGVSFAFLPVGSRPLDYWLAAFLKAIYAPTNRVWKKNGKNFKEDSLFGSRLVTYLSSVKSPLEKVAPVINQPPTSPILSTTAPSDLPSKEELEKTVDLAKQAQNLQMKIIQTERTLSQIKTEAQKPTPIPIDYTEQVNQVLADLQILVSQASQVKKQLQSVTQPEGPTKDEAAALSIPKEKVKVVIPVKAKPAQVALTTFPNVISGIVKDAAGNYLEGVVAVIYDKEGLPVRALKTNKLGQFTGSTPLPSGTYTLELEKDNFSFDVLQIELTNQILPPLPITAKQ